MCGLSKEHSEEAEAEREGGWWEMIPEKSYRPREGFGI